jgi:hypothetical protein
VRANSISWRGHAALFALGFTLSTIWWYLFPHDLTMTQNVLYGALSGLVIGGVWLVAFRYLERRSRVETPPHDT